MARELQSRINPKRRSVEKLMPQLSRQQGRSSRCDEKLSDCLRCIGNTNSGHGSSQRSDHRMPARSRGAGICDNGDRVEGHGLFEFEAVRDGVEWEIKTNDDCEVLIQQPES